MILLNKLKFLVLIVLFSFLLFGCTQPPVVVDPKNLVSENSSNFRGFAVGDEVISEINIEYPDNWIVQETMFGDYTTFTRPSVSESELFQESVNLYVEDLFDFEVVNDRQMTLEEYTADNILSFREYLPEFSLLSSNPIIIDNNPAHEIIYTGYRTDVNMDLMFKSVWTIKNNKSYTITYVSTRERFYDFLPTAQKMIDSFKVDN